MPKQEKSRLSAYSAVILTGGSSGIGRAFLEACLLREPSLKIANLSRSRPQVSMDSGRCQHYTVDLGRREEVSQIFYAVSGWLREAAPEGKLLLVNNSGIGCYGEFPEPDVERNLALIDLNVRAVVEWTGRWLPELRRRGGGVVNVASTAAFQPVPYMSVYAASKAFLLSWGLGLHEELKGDGVFCQTFCPGPTRTAFFANAGFSQELLPAGAGQSAEAVAEAMIRAVGRKTSLAVSGFPNWVIAGIGGTLPRRWLAPATAVVMRRLRVNRLGEKP